MVYSVIKRTKNKYEPSNYPKALESWKKGRFFEKAAFDLSFNRRVQIMTM